MKKHGRYLGAGILMVIIVFVISYGTITPFVGKLSIIDVSSAFGRDETLTERTVIWASLVPYAMKNPLLGHGYGGFWNDKMRRETSSHAHNGYLDTILDLGIIGVIFFSVFLVSSCKKAYSIMAYEFDWSILWICFLLMAAVHNIAESSITSLENLLVSILLFLAVCSKNSLIHTPVLVRARYFTKR
jgi:O-antigen ligase